MENSRIITASESTLNWRRVNTLFRFIYIWSDLYSFFIWRNYHGWAWLTTNLISKFSKISTFPQIHANWGFLANLFFRRFFLRVDFRSELGCYDRKWYFCDLLDLISGSSSWKIVRCTCNDHRSFQFQDRKSNFTWKIVSLQGFMIVHLKCNKLKSLKKFVKFF